jgi:selenocysteine lyase/cysteine desulfurase
MELEQRLGGYAAARLKQDDLAQVYVDIAKLIHASSPNEIALVESATVAWTRLFYSMVDCQDTTLEKGRRKVILLSEAEYAANVVAASQWARMHTEWTVLPIPSSTNSDGSSTGIVDMNVFQSMLEGLHDLALVCVTHIPTNSGIVNPVEEMGRLIEEYNKNTDSGEILFLVDACQSVGQLDVNAHDMKCHGLAATGRKYLRGPRGTGFLYVQKDIAESLIPSHLDHACAPITTVPLTYPPPNSVEDWIDIKIQPGAKRFEFWESNVAGKLGLGEAIRFAMNEMGLDHICACCELLVAELVALLEEIDGIDLHHASSCGIVTFSVRDIDAAAVKELLWNWQPEDDCRFEVSVVPATSTPLDSARCQVLDLVRASISYTTSIEDIERFCTRLKAIIKDQQ